MSAEDIRATIVEALLDLNATKDVPAARLTAFESTGKDIRLGDLNLGSLGRMELLVALEVEHGAVIDPEAFLDLGSLNDVVALAQRALDGGEAARPAERRLGDEPDRSMERAESTPAIVRLFQRAFRSCRAVAQLNKLLKLLEHRLTPPQLATLRTWHEKGELIPAATSPRFAARLTEWLDQQGGLMDGTGKTRPEPYTAERIAPAAVLFRGPGEPEKKMLLICFPTVGARQMWMPNALLLQHTDAHEVDVLVLSDLWRTGFRAGVPLIGRDVDDLVGWIEGLGLASQYDRVRTLGCSAGAYPAMLTARRLDAELAVGICGRFPKLRPRHLRQIIDMHRNSWIAARRNPDARVLLIHGGKRRDRMFARRTARMTGASRLQLKMPGRVVPHNVVRPLIEHGELGSFLRHCLFASTEDRLLARQGVRATLTIPIDGGAATPTLTVRGRA